MANLVFAEQRGADGSLNFAEQVASPVVVISASAASVSTVIATLQTPAQHFAAVATSSSSTSATLSFVNVFISALANSESTVNATLGKYVSVRANAMSVSSASATLAKYALISAMSQSTSTVVATLNAIDVGTVDIFAVAISESATTAKLYTSVSNIPLTAIVKAVPLESESKQLVRFRGDTYADTFVVFDNSTGLPLDVTGCNFRLALSTKKNPTPTDPRVYTITGQAIQPTSGIVYFAPSSIQADRTGFFYYDMEMTDSNGIVRTLISSSYVYTQDITI